MVFNGYYYPDYIWKHKPHKNEITGEYEGDSVFNFVVGNRRGGKSVGIGIFAIADFLCYGYKIVIIRRYMKEFEDSKKPALENFIKKALPYISEFPRIARQSPDLKRLYPEEVLNKVDWDNVEADFDGHQCFINGELFAEPVALNRVDGFKNNNYDNVHTVIYDEFIAEKGTANLPGEVMKFLIAFDTIARNRPDALKTTGAVFIGNAVTYANPFFTEYDIDRRLKKDTKRLLLKDKAVAVEIVENEIAAEEIKVSLFGRALSAGITGRFYLGYSQGNQSQDENSFIKKPSGKREYILNIKTGGRLYAFCKYGGEYFFTDSEVIENWPRTYSVEPSDHTEENILLKGTLKGKLSALKEVYSYGLLYFNAQRSKNAFLSIFPML